MADDTSSDTFRLDLDASAFVDEVLRAQTSISQLGNSEALSGLVEGFLSAGAAVGALGVALFAAKEAADLIFDAERIQQVNAEFETLSRNAGVYSDTLKAGLVESSKGWVDETTLMQAANKAMIGLEVGVDKLPDLMKIAQQATAVMGGTAVDNFNMIAKAVESGNTRQLRHLGIIIDQQKAYRDFATSMGITVNELSQAGKQQAVLNAVLEQGNEKLPKGSDDLLRFTSIWNQFKTTVTEVKEGLTLLFYQAITPVLEGVGKIAKAYSDLQTKLVNFGVSIGKLYRGGTTEASKGLGDLHKADDQLAQQEITHEKISKDIFVDKVKRAKDEADFKKELASIDQQLLQQELGNMTSVEEATRVYHAQLAQQGAAVQAQIDQVRAKVAAGTLTQAQADQEIVKLNELKNKKMEADDAQLHQLQSQALDQYVAHSETAFDGIGRAFSATAQKNKIAMSDMGTFGSNTVAAFSKSATSNIQAWGAGTKSATQAIEGMFAGMAGDMASQYGQMMMLAAIWPPNPPAFAAGVALVALGGYLSSLGGGGSTTSSAASVAAPTAQVAIPPATGVATQAPTSAAATTAANGPNSVNLIIQGHMFANDQTARWIVDQVRSAADATDFKIQSVGGGL